jgi:hypothetical protein
MVNEKGEECRVYILRKRDSAEWQALAAKGENAQACVWAVGKFYGDVPLFVEHYEAVAAEIDVTRRWLGEQGRGLSFSVDRLRGRPAMRADVCEPLIAGIPSRLLA